MNTRPGDALLAEYVCISATGAAEELTDMCKGGICVNGDVGGGGGFIPYTSSLPVV